MLTNILASIIGDTFTRKIGRNQADKPLDQRQALKLSFSLSLDYNIEDGYRWLDILIYAPKNYVGVLARERQHTFFLDDIDHYTDQEEPIFKPGKSHIESTSPWKSFGFHDSCWLQAVNSIICNYEHRLLTINGDTNNWFITLPMTTDLQSQFYEVTRTRDSTMVKVIVSALIGC